MKNPELQIKSMFLAASLLITPGLVGAQSNEAVQHMQAAHGGQLRSAGAYHMELVVRTGELQLWMTDHGNKPQSTVGAEGTATVVGPAGRIPVRLSPIGNNGLSGKDKRIKPAKDLRVIVTVSMNGQQPVQARFMPDANASDSHAGHHGG